jgi:hypothetical protein
MASNAPAGPSLGAERSSAVRPHRGFRLSSIPSV